jgi:6-phosphogluconolactonase
MKTHRSVAVALAGSTVGLGLLLTPTAASASDVSGYDYVNDNSAGANTIAAYARHTDGSLTALPGSPFAAGGSGLGRGLGSQGAIQASPDGRFLLAVDAGSSEISVLSLAIDGVPTVRDVVNSGGAQPVSVTISDKGLVYVANVGDGGSNYTGFRLGGSGKLVPIPHSTITVPEGSGVGDVFFNPAGERVVGTRDNTSLIDSFAVQPNGRLDAAPGSPIPAQDLGPIGAQFRPTDSDQLFVSNAHGGPGNGSVSAYHVAGNGALTAVSPAPYRNGRTASCWVEISHDGKYLFSVNTASADISRYSIAPDGALTLLGTTPFTNGAGAVDERLSPDGRYLAVTGGRSRVLSSFSVDGGDLTELASSPVALPAGTAPTGVVSL